MLCRKAYASEDTKKFTIGQIVAKHPGIILKLVWFLFFFFQNQCPEAEQLVFSHFVICNDTQETLRFGQVDTDENVLLESLHSHQYSWRSHKSPQVCMPYKCSCNSC